MSRGRCSWLCTSSPGQPVGNTNHQRMKLWRGAWRSVNVTDTPHFLLVPPAHLHSRDSDRTTAGWPASRMARVLAKERTREPHCPGSNPASSTCLLWRNHPQLQNLNQPQFSQDDGNTYFVWRLRNRGVISGKCLNRV